MADSPVVIVVTANEKSANGMPELTSPTANTLAQCRRNCGPSPRQITSGSRKAEAIVTRSAAVAIGPELDHGQSHEEEGAAPDRGEQHEIDGPGARSALSVLTMPPRWRLGPPYCTRGGLRAFGRPCVAQACPSSRSNAVLRSSPPA